MANSPKIQKAVNECWKKTQNSINARKKDNGHSAVLMQGGRVIPQTCKTNIYGGNNYEKHIDSKIKNTCTTHAEMNAIIAGMKYGHLPYIKFEESNISPKGKWAEGVSAY